MNFIDTKAFIIVETVLYLSYLSLDIGGFSLISGYIKFASIVILFLFVWIKSIWKMELNWIPLALGFSVFADFFLLFSNNYIPGLCAFCLVQLFLCIHIHQLFRMPYKPQILIVSCCLVIETIGGIVYHVISNITTILALSYFLFFLSNLIMIGYAWYRGKICTSKRWLFSIGCFLFFLCDIHVGLYNISDYYTIVGNQLDSNWFYFGMWMFYLPGQLLIGCSNGIPSKSEFVSKEKFLA